MATTTEHANALTFDLDGAAVFAVPPLLDLLAEHGVHATMFTAGPLARRHPALMRRIVAAGHELASHGYARSCAATQTRDHFRRDIVRSKGVLEDSTGRAVLGYRAPGRVLTGPTPWAMDLLYLHGYRYSSGSWPPAGAPAALRAAAFPSGPRGILALPLAMLHCGPCHLAWRASPAWLARTMLRWINRDDPLPAVVRLLPAPLCQRPALLANLARAGRWDRVDRLFPVLP